MKLIRSIIPIPDLIYKYIRLYRLNRLISHRIIHIINNQYPKIKKCNICNWEGKIFIEQEARCPICFSMPRHRLLSYLLEKENLINKKILIIGPDMTEILMLRNKTNSNVKILNIIDTPFTDIVCDITKYKLENTSFDFVFMWHVLEHIKDDVMAVENIFNLLKENGKFFFSVPIFPGGNKFSYVPEYQTLKEKIQKMGHHDHVLCCGEDYGSRFNSIKFREQKKVSVKKFREAEIDKYHLNINHYAWIFTK